MILFLIVDISCDYNKLNNPIKIYENLTTWSKPVFNYNDYISIISINNLPSLLPYESSSYFSNIFKHLLLNQSNDIWIKNIDIFNNIISKL